MMESGPEIDQAVCRYCTQYVAACPNRALLWDDTNPVAFERQRLPSAEQLDELFKERRSIRRLKRKKIDRVVLYEIASYGIYAPTHTFDLRVIIVDDESLIASLDQAIGKNCRLIYNLAYRFKLAGILVTWFGFGEEMYRAKPKLEGAMRMDHAFYSMPTALILIAGNKKVPLSSDSAQYALANMMYYTQVSGVGTCLWGNGPFFIDKNKLARQQLGSNPGERIYDAMYMGYPAARFSNKVVGKLIQIQRNSLN